MSTRELIQEEIARLSDEDLDELYRVIKNFARSKDTNRESSLMSRLKQVRIDAPEDFAATLDRYISGDKRAEPDLP